MEVNKASRVWLAPRSHYPLVLCSHELCCCRLELLRHHKFPPGPLPQLQIITGKGNHSSEGEGSLGHAVNTFLQAHELTSTPRGGVVCVNLKRSA